MGLRVRVIGEPAPAGRPVVFASNHSSWLDVLTLGSTLEACFIAKDEVGHWPGIRTVARLGRTVFVSRRAADTRGERDDDARPAGGGRQSDPVPGGHQLGWLPRAAVPLGLLLDRRGAGAKRRAGR